MIPDCNLVLEQTGNRILLHFTLICLTVFYHLLLFAAEERSFAYQKNRKMKKNTTYLSIQAELLIFFFQYKRLLHANSSKTDSAIRMHFTIVTNTHFYAVAFYLTVK